MSNDGRVNALRNIVKTTTTHSIAILLRRKSESDVVDEKKEYIVINQRFETPESQRLAFKYYNYFFNASQNYSHVIHDVNISVVPPSSHFTTQPFFPFLDTMP